MNKYTVTFQEFSPVFNVAYDIEAEDRNEAVEKARNILAGNVKGKEEIIATMFKPTVKENK